MDVSDIDLAEAIAQARQLDPFALGQLHDACYPPVFRYFNFRVFDQAISQKLAEELFGMLLSSWNKIGSEPPELLTWLFTTAAEMVDDALHRPAPADLSEPQVIPGKDASLDPLAEEIAWLGSLMRKALGGLSGEQQHLLALRFAGSQTLADISRLTGKSLSEVRSLQYATLETLRKLLEHEADA